MGLFQRLLQVLVLIALGFVIVKPQILPPVAQPYAFGVQRYVFGDEVSIKSLQITWFDRWKVITTKVPIFGSWSGVVAPEPPTISADSVMKLIIQMILVQPVKKWDTIKQQLFVTTTSASSSASTSATINP